MLVIALAMAAPMVVAVSLVVKPTAGTGCESIQSWIVPAFDGLVLAT